MYLPGTAAVIDDEVVTTAAAAEAKVAQVSVIGGGIADYRAGPLAVLASPDLFRSAAAAYALPCTDDPDLFFAESPDDVELAKSICRGCPVQASCLTGAIERREPWGVWGGELFLRGEILPRKRPRGRPRKNPVAA
jgi:WhiB family transcriptional regulator, redox-sensing transcriptional regulator